MKQAQIAKSKSWTMENVERTRATVRALVSANCRKMAPLARLNHLAKKVLLLETSRSDLDHMLRFFYVLAMLEHQAEWGGLSIRRLKELRGLARTLLVGQGIRISESRLSYLYSEIHLADAQSLLNEGHIWRATFEQQRARHLGMRGGKPIAAALHLAGAKTAIRLGNADLAVSHLTAAEAGDLPPGLLQTCRLLRTRTLRLSGRLGEAEELYQRFRVDGAASGGAEDWQWEGLRQSSLRLGSLSAIAAAVRPGKAHHLGLRILELALLQRASRETSAIIKLSTASPLTRKKGMVDERERFLRRVALTFEECYDPSVPLDRAMEGLGGLADSALLLPTVELELAFWLGLTRWAARHHATALAQLAFGQYQALSLKLSKGRQPDVLGLSPDLFERSWIKELELS